MTSDQLVNLAQALGVGGLGMYALIQLLAFVRWFVEGERQNRKEVADALKTINDRQVAHDDQIDEIEVKVDKVTQTLKPAIEGLTSGLADINSSMIASSKAHTESNQQMVASLNDHTTAIGINSTDIKKNSDDNTQKIIDKVIEELGKLASDDGAIAIHANRIIEAFQAMAKASADKDQQIKTLTQRLFDLQAKNAGIPTGDPDPTIPLVKLSPVDGEVNRELIDKAKTATGEHGIVGEAAK